MSKSSASFRRAPARFKPQPRVLALCEDSKSALNYLVDASRHFRANAEVRIAHCGRTDPIGIVEMAVRQRKNFDTVFCVIDRDEHDSFDAALQRASAFPNIVVICSYPCYEFWLYLHVRYSRAGVTSVGAQSAGARMAATLRELGPFAGYQKGASESVFAQLLDRLPTARANAARVLAEALDDGEMNPSTKMHLLIDAIEDLGKLKPV
ncbi:RloB family protein [Burkholderiaceae bacterium UC74_6]